MAEDDRLEVESVEQFKEGREAELLRSLSQRVRGLLQGAGNNHFNVRLDPDKTQTEVQVEFVTELSTVQFSPRTASAATAYAAGVVFADSSPGLITIHHDSLPDEDRRFAVTVNG